MVSVYTLHCVWVSVCCVFTSCKSYIYRIVFCLFKRSFTNSQFDEQIYSWQVAFFLYIQLVVKEAIDSGCWDGGEGVCVITTVKIKC